MSKSNFNKKLRSITSINAVVKSVEALNNVLVKNEFCLKGSVDTGRAIRLLIELNFYI